MLSKMDGGSISRGYLVLLKVVRISLFDFVFFGRGLLVSVCCPYLCIHDGKSDNTPSLNAAILSFPEMQSMKSGHRKRPGVWDLSGLLFRLCVIPCSRIRAEHLALYFTATIIFLDLDCVTCMSFCMANNDNNSTTINNKICTLRIKSECEKILCRKHCPCCKAEQHAKPSQSCNSS